VRALLLVAGFAAAVLIRVVVGGVGVAQSPTGGVLFGSCLVALCWSARLRVPVSWRAVGLGLAGAAVLCLPVVVFRPDRPLAGVAGFAGWAVVVTFVAAAEELFLRGALYDAVLAAARRPDLAIVVSAVAFALLHVPLYGWHVVPLDLAVGLLLGELRRRAGTPAAPAVAHVVADLAGWFLR
jgi:membrane protease YdiL (CAAX protease family)